MSTEAYLEHVRELMPTIPDLRFRRMFGGVGVYSGAQMFALIADEQLYLKADEETRQLFEAAGVGPFSMTTKEGRTMTMSYWRLPPLAEEDATEAEPWVEAALSAAQRAKRPKRKAGFAHDLGPGPWDD